MDGRVIAGKYDLLRKLGAGGMAEVFLARQRGVAGFEKLVVVKRILPHLAENAEFVTMLQAEARVAADLRHPNVVSVNEVGVDDGVWYIAMEFLDGHDLARVLRESAVKGVPIPLEVAVQIVIASARGLHYAHQKKDLRGQPLNIVHRDVSPKNLHVTYDGITKVLDFGIARAVSTLGETGAGMVKGTFNYLSPEQAMGGALDARSDQFALGIVLLDVTTLSATMGKKREVPIFRQAFDGALKRPSSIVEGYPRGLEEVVLRSLRLRVEDRFASLQEMASALESFLEDARLRGSEAKTSEFLASLLPRQEMDLTLPVAEQVPAAPAPTRIEPTRMSRSNLPAEAGTLVGRKRELDAIASTFADGARLVTLLGPGGAGKSAVALHYGVTARPAYATEGGVWICDLTEARDADGVIASVGRALSVSLAPGASSADAVAQIGHALAGRGKMLVLFDTFEHVVGAGPQTVAAWMGIAPDARFLVTSRERLKLDGEQVIELSSLSLPQEGRPVTDSEAVQLFTQRAKAVRASFSISKADEPVVAQIVQELDGIPLAIELAAARMAVLTPAKLLERLPRRFELLAGAKREVSSRQATLRGAIEWSWNLLPAWEQRALAQASVFRGGFSLESAEAVIDLSGLDGSPMVFDVVQSLRDKSLLRAWEPPDLPGELRFAAYVNVREFAAEKLEQSGARAEAERRHAEHFVEASGPWIAGANRREGLELRKRIALELDNLQELLRRAGTPNPKAPADPATRAVWALHAALAIGQIAARIPMKAHLANLDLAVGAAAHDGVERTLLARVLEMRGRARRLAGRVDESLEDLEEAKSLSRQAGDRALEAQVLVQVGTSFQAKGESEDAREAVQKALLLAREAKDTEREGLAFGYLGTVLHVSGDLDRGMECYQRSLHLLRSAGNVWMEAAMSANFGAFLLQVGRYEEARAILQKGLQLAREVGERNFEANALGLIATLFHLQERYEEALIFYDQAYALQIQTGVIRSMAHVHGNRGLLHHDMERIDQARADYERAVEIARGMGDRRLLGLYLAYQAALEAEHGEAKRAAALLHEARLQHNFAQNRILLGVDDLVEGFLDLAKAREGNARAHLESARKRCATACASTPKTERHPEGGPPLVAESDEARMVLKLLERAVRKQERRLTSAGAAG